MEKSLIEKLSLIQIELKAPKNQYNSFGKYKYRNCEDILESVKPLCNKNRCTLIIEDEICVYENRYYVKAKATLKDWDSDMSITTSALAREEENKKGMDSSQVTGATSSYARKYALNGLFNIDDTKDTDTEEFQSKAKKTDKKKQENNNQNMDKNLIGQQKLVSEIHKKYKDNKTFQAIFKSLAPNVKKFTDLTLEQCNNIIATVEASRQTLEGVNG